LGSIQSELQNELSSMNDLSDEQSTLLQMAMNQYSQILQLMSNMLKSVGDTENAIVSNIKQ
jgi:type III secretion apparatus needle protein